MCVLSCVRRTGLVVEVDAVVDAVVDVVVDADVVVVDADVVVVEFNNIVALLLVNREIYIYLAFNYRILSSTHKTIF